MLERRYSENHKPIVNHSLHIHYWFSKCSFRFDTRYVNNHIKTNAFHKCSSYNILSTFLKEKYSLDDVMFKHLCPPVTCEGNKMRKKKQVDALLAVTPIFISVIFVLSADADPQPPTLLSNLSSYAATPLGDVFVIDINICTRDRVIGEET
jgi:hypothetical protein